MQRPFINVISFPQAVTAHKGSLSLQRAVVGLFQTLLSRRQTKTATVRPQMLALLLALALPGVYAIETDYNQPILIDSEKQQIDLKENKTVFERNVSVVQGSMSIKADKLLAYRQNQKGHEVFIATGNPAIYKQTLSDGKPIVAEANTIRYDVKTRSLTLTGNAQLKQNDSLVKGKTIRYDLVKQTLEAEGSDGKPVQSIFNTEDKDGKPAPQKEQP